MQGSARRQWHAAVRAALAALHLRQGIRRRRLVAVTAYNFTEKIGLVGEVAGFENTWLAAGQSRESVNQVRSLMAGPRAASAFMHTGGMSPDDTRVFVQLLAGIQVSNLTPTRLAIRPGGGLDVSTRTGVIVRLGLDYTFPSPEARDLSGGRFIPGIVIAIPAR